MNNKVQKIKKRCAIFLAIVLVAGTVAAISPTFIIKGVNAQGDSYYGLDSYEPEYQQSYKPDYKPTYPSYGEKDNRDKSQKDDKNVIDIKKIKCNNINVNLNVAGGTGNGDNGNTTNGNGDSGNKNDEFKKIDKDGFTFICINNNNNVVSGGNQTIPPEPEPTCEECFSILSDADREGFLGIIDDILTSLNVPHEELLTIGDLCEFLETSTAISPQDKRALLNTALNSESVPAADINSILSCLEDLRIL